MLLEIVSHTAGQAADVLFRAGILTFVAAVGADTAIHVFAWQALEPTAHLATFVGMTVGTLGLVIRGSTPQRQRKERLHASR